MILSSLDLSKLTLQYNRVPGESRYFVEELGEGVELDMTLIPSGTFVMGSPEDELERLDREGPQRPVTVQSFCMGTYPITQAQWRVVASFEQVDRVLDSAPSRFKGNKRPVESVSWEEAIEFCKRLSNHTSREYRLPSEAEWEYACRAGTQTPFHFGPTITTDYANYCGDGSTGGNASYGPGPEGAYRRETTPVDEFELPNAFGLFDMHGNVWEWCEDDYHSSYDKAPTDGSAWIDEPRGKSRILRGGSWYYYPGACRSAYRSNLRRDHRGFHVGLRVVVSAPGLSIP